MDVSRSTVSGKFLTHAVACIRIVEISVFSVVQPLMQRWGFSKKASFSFSGKVFLQARWQYSQL